MTWTLATWWTLPEAEKNFWMADDWARQDSLREYVERLKEKEGGILAPELVQLLMLLETL